MLAFSTIDHILSKSLLSLDDELFSSTSRPAWGFPVPICGALLRKLWGSTFLGLRESLNWVHVL